MLQLHAKTPIHLREGLANTYLVSTFDSLIEHELAIGLFGLAHAVIKFVGIRDQFDLLWRADTAQGDFFPAAKTEPLERNAIRQGLGRQLPAVQRGVFQLLPLAQHVGDIVRDLYSRDSVRPYVRPWTPPSFL